MINQAGKLAIRQKDRVTELWWLLCVMSELYWILYTVDVASWIT
jgi:hypothetical protein